MSYPKTCILCKHYLFFGGEPDYSDFTPGDEWESECKRGRWHMSGRHTYTEEYRETLLTANTCKDFELCDLLKKEQDDNI